MTIKFKKSLVGKPAPAGVHRTGIEVREWYLANGKCPEIVWGRDRWSRGHLCGRPIKDHNRGLCGLHVGALTRRENADAARAAKRQSSEDNAAHSDRLVNALNKVLPRGQAAQHYVLDPSTGLRFTGKVVLTADAAEALIDLLTRE